MQSSAFKQDNQPVERASDRGRGDGEKTSFHRPISAFLPGGKVAHHAHTAREALDQGFSTPSVDYTTSKKLAKLMIAVDRRFFPSECSEI